MIYLFLFSSAREEEKNTFSLFCHLRRLIFNQSSPVHPVSESWGGGPLSFMEEKKKNDRSSYWRAILKCLVFSESGADFLPE